MKGQKNMKNTTQNEIWKDIHGYEGYYQVSNLGRIKSMERDVLQGTRIVHLHSKILKYRYDAGGYIRIVLCKNGIQKNFSLHRLVAEHFIPNPNNLPQINHKDENKENNCVDNLEWCTPKYNTNYGTRTQRAANTSKGKTFTLEQRKKLSQARKGYVTSEETKNKISESLSNPVYQYDLNNKLIKKWRNIQEPKRSGMPYDPTCFSKCCLGKLKTYKGFIWKRYLIEEC